MQLFSLRQPARHRLHHERDLVAQHGERNALQLLLEADYDDAVHGGEQRARQERALVGGQRRRKLAQRRFDVVEQPVQVRRVPGGHRASLGQAVVEEGAPARPMRRRIVGIGEREMDERPDRVGVRVGVLGAGDGQRLLEFVERARVHREDEIVEVVEHIVDRPDRAAGLGGQFARLHPGQTLARDRALGSRDQRVPQLAPAGRRLGLGCRLSLGCRIGFGGHRLGNH